ncbi:DUF4082 domain-containing protein [Bradyrhizobium sp. CW1]|uniref:DUF4082 domain-containing protein n=1 Tax=Bradyrhizobium sp. CW1 TaxID=2782686 RepID=UPI001FFFC6FE|nr:DUF4082 domain-containing protein [Bradyrhizobium sp. CW1]
MLVQKASVFGRGARAVFPGEDIPASDVFWREAPFWNAFDGSDPPGRWGPPFANPPAGDATFFPQSSRAGPGDQPDLHGVMPRLFSPSFQSRLSALLSSTSLTSRYQSLAPTFPSAASEWTPPTSSSVSTPGTTHWTNSSDGVWNVATNWSAGVPGIIDSAFLDAAGAYVVTSTASVDIKSLVVDAGATLSFGAGSPFIVEGDVLNNGTVEVGAFLGDRIATGDFKGDVSGTGSFEISDKSILEIGGSVSGRFLNGSFSGITVAFDTGSGALVLDQSAEFHGLIAGSSPGAPLSPGNLIDLKDLPFTSSMSATVHYNNSSNISAVDFSNGAANVTLLFSGMDLNWNFKSDGQGGTIVSDPPTNPIVLENQKPGTPKSVWQIQPGDNSHLTQGFATAISTNVGGTVQFKINNLTGNPNYRVDLYRLGYYGGDGARLVTSLQHQAAAAVVQPAPLSDPSRGLVDAGNWSVTDSWSVPTDAVSGVYIANVVNGTEIFQVPFIIRNDASHSDIVLQTSDEDWQAYNGWGGANLYFGNGPGIAGSAFAVSYNRPLVTRDGEGTFSEGGDSPFTAEFAAIQWLEQNGYDVSYISGIDAATNGSLLLNHKVFMDAGHDEYWTEAQRANVEAAAHAGVNLAFLTGNEIFWKTRLAPSIDGSGTANRTLISYKDTHANALIDPTGKATGNYSDPRFGPPLPSNELTGTLFAVNAFRYDTITIPYSMTQLRFWRNTAVAQTSPGQTASLVPGLLGVEWDTAPDNGFRPAGLISVSSSTVQVTGQYLLDYGNTFANGTATHNLVLHRDPVSGALIFSAGSINWPWALASDHDGPATPVDPNVQQAMVNLFADMGVQPATLQANLVAAIQSTDATAPTSAITNLSAASVVEGQSITVTGTATDTGGKIAGVEISTDAGTTWHPGNSNVGAANVTWSYTFVTGAQGTYNLKTRAVDDSLNLETLGAGVTYTVTPSSNLTLFSITDTPAVISNDDSGSVELGVKFVPAVSGKITGIRFYKGPQNTGTHIGDLWTTNGTLLGSATFTNETASGWQQVNFATPISVTAGVTYVASYHTNTGHYSSTDFYFINYGGLTKGALTAPGSSLNGVFAYGSGPIFPDDVSSTKAANYWVDVVFSDSGATSPQANGDSGFTVTQNGVLNIPASALLANDTNPSGLAFSLSGVSNPVNGSVSYNAQNQTVTFTPTNGYAGTASFTYTITDTSGQSGSGQVSLNVSYPISAQSLFGTNDAPGAPNSGDTSPVEVGVKFTASVNGTITGLRFYKGSLNTGPHVADLWSSTGALLATATFTNETASGWQQVNFSNPVGIAAGTTYVASYHTNGNYSGTQNYFTTSLTNGQLTAPAGGNGVYGYGSGSVFPTSSYNASNYWVDVVFNGSSITNNTPPTAVADVGDATEKGGVNNSIGGKAATGNLLTNDTDPDAGDTKTVTAVRFGSTSGTLGSALSGAHGSLVLNASGTFSYAVNETDPAVQALRLATDTLTDIFNYTMRDTAGATSSTTLTVTIHGANDAPVLAIQTGSQTATVGSAFSLTLPAGTFPDVDSGDSLTYTATAGGSSLPAWLAFNASTRTFSGTPTSADLGTLSVTVSAADLGNLTGSETFDIAVSSVPSAVSLFSSSDTPAILSNSDASQVNLGVQFTSSVAGTITGIKYYKSANDPGTHTGLLWSSTGTLLASATFTNEGSSGWQTVTFSNPVSIAAGTTYVASFHSNGHYASSTSYFTTARTSGPLTAPANINGLYTYGTTNLFPTSSYNASNYWVDVVFNGSSTTNNTPPTAVADVGDATEKGGVNNSTAGTAAIGNVLTNDTDPDAGDTKTVTAVSFGSTGGTLGSALSGAHGSLVLNASGTFTYTVNETDPAVQALLSTNTLSDIFNYTMRDTAGATSSTTLTVTTHGANDAPVLAVQTGDQTATVGTSFSLTLPAGTFTDVDSGDSLAYTATAADGTALPAWLTFDASTRTFSGTPTSTSAGTLSVKTSVTDFGGLSASETFNLAVTTAPSGLSLFSTSDTPAILSNSDTSQVNLGMQFTSSVAGTITGIKYYKSANDTGTHTGSLWSSTGTLLASATFTNEGSSGWQTVTFSNPVSIAAGIPYVASFHSNGHYASSTSYFTTAHTSGPLTAPANINGVYTYGTSNLFPTNTYKAANYWVDVMFNSLSGGANQLPVAANDSGLYATQNVPFAIPTSVLLANDTDPDGDKLTITSASGGVNGVASFNAQSNSVIFTPTTGYTGSASFNYSISDGHGGTASTSVALNVTAASSTTVSLFSASQVPSIVAANDPNSVELGVKFQTSTPGDVVGIRFYKGPSNTGTHVADLWSSTGNLLATATFTSETAGSWQQVNFATPVTIMPGTTYVASYHTAGNYAADPGLLASAITNGPLTAPSSASIAGNGVFAYGTDSLFPNNTYNATSYGVDVVFRQQLAA